MLMATEGYFPYNDHLIPFRPEERLPFTKLEILRTLGTRMYKDLTYMGLTYSRYKTLVNSKDYSFQTFEIAVEICRDTYPKKKWEYPSIEELRAFYAIPKHAQSIDHNTQVTLKKSIPRVNKYFQLWEIMVYIKSQEKSQTGGASNVTNNQQAQ